MPDDDHGRPGPLREPRERRQGSPYVLVAVGVDLSGQERYQRIYDGQHGPDTLDGGLDDVQIVRYGYLALVAFGVGDRGEGHGAGGVSAGGVEARADGIRQAVFGGKDHHSPGPALRAVWPRLANAHISEDGRVNQKPMEVREFTREAIRFRDLLHLYTEIRESDVTAVTQRSLEPRSAVDQELAAYVLPALEEEYPNKWERHERVLEAFFSLSLNRVLALADRFLADQLSESLAGVRLRTVPGFQIPHGASEEDKRSLMMSLKIAPSSKYTLRFSWHCSDLISAIYLQLFLLATKNTPMRFCKACQTPFPAKPKHKRLCNSTCRSNGRNHR